MGRHFLVQFLHFHGIVSMASAWAQQNIELKFKMFQVLALHINEFNVYIYEINNNFAAPVVFSENLSTLIFLSK